MCKFIRALSFLKQGHDSSYLLKLAELLEDILGPKFDDAAAVPRGAIEEAATGGWGVVGALLIPLGLGPLGGCCIWAEVCCCCNEGVVGDGFEGCNDDEEDDATFDLLGGAKFVGVRGRSERIRKEEEVTSFFGHITTENSHSGLDVVEWDQGVCLETTNKI